MGISDDESLEVDFVEVDFLAVCRVASDLNSSDIVGSGTLPERRTAEMKELPHSGSAATPPIVKFRF